MIYPYEPLKATLESFGLNPNSVQVDQIRQLLKSEYERGWTGRPTYTDLEHDADFYTPNADLGGLAHPPTRNADLNQADNSGEETA